METRTHKTKSSNQNCIGIALSFFKHSSYCERDKTNIFVLFIKFLLRSCRSHVSKRLSYLSKFMGTVSTGVRTMTQVLIAYQNSPLLNKDNLHKCFCRGQLLNKSKGGWRLYKSIVTLFSSFKPQLTFKKRVKKVSQSRK